jgi:hypothetical protein
MFNLAGRSMAPGVVQVPALASARSPRAVVRLFSLIAGIWMLAGIEPLHGEMPRRAGIC